MNQGTTPLSDRRPGVGQVPELCGEGYRYSPGHTLPQHSNDAPLVAN